MAITLEEYEANHVDENGDLIEDEQWFNAQAVLGTKEDLDSAYDEEGNFHCIGWFDCAYCPAFSASHCL